MSARRAALALALVACAPARAEAPPPSAHAAHVAAQHGAATDPRESALDAVAAVHGAPGPWAVAGWRMGEHALARLGLPRGSFDLEVVHRSPREVQFSCIADGAAAYSGASVGKLNLSLEQASEADLVTIYRNRKTGAAIALRPSASFRARYLGAPRERARELGREVLDLPDADVFEEVPAR